MIINSELPVGMLPYNLEYNQFDFVLFHLLENGKYRDYYRTLRQERPERLMILDNSAYEFHVKEKTLDMGSFAAAVEYLRPDYYLCPDVLMDMDRTIQGTIQFLKTYQPSGSTPMAVIQGNSSEELRACLEAYRTLGLDNIAIPFHNSFYRDTVSNEYMDLWRSFIDVDTPDARYAAGRCEFIHENVDLLRKFRYIHLLGSHHPMEKSIHRIISPGIVNSMDTGYPVKVGLAGYELFDEPGKPEVIIDDFLDQDIPEDTVQRILRNIKKFADL